MGRRRAEADAKINLPITPMLDMTFQLLFFFIMNFNPADLEGQMDMALPSEQSAKEKIGQPTKAEPSDKVPEEFPADLTIQVRTDQGEGSEGGLRAMFVSDANGKEDPVNGLDGLKKYLEDKKASLTNKESVKIRGEGKLRIKHLMRVMDTCKAAGFPNTSLIPPENQSR